MTVFAIAKDPLLLGETTNWKIREAEEADVPAKAHAAGNLITEYTVTPKTTNEEEK